LVTQHIARGQDASPFGTLTPIPDIAVNAPQPLKNDGSAAAGYRVDDIGTEGGSTGLGTFWSDLPIQDAPYSLFVTPAELIQNMQVNNIIDALKYDPSIQYYGNGTASGGYRGGQFAIRGFLQLASSITTDGLVTSGGNNYINSNIQLEDKEYVSVLSGNNGFLYGVQNVGGHIDTTLKRPTAVPLYEVEGGTNTGRNGYVHADIGGPLSFPGIDPGIFGYRLNLVDQGGGTQIHNQQISRNLESLALDAHLPSNLLIQFNASHSQYDIWGVTPLFLSSLGLPPLYLSPANPSQIYAAPFSKIATEDDLAGVKVTWKPNDIFTLRSEYHYDRSYTSNANQFSDTVGTVSPNGNMSTLTIGTGTGYTYYTNAGYTYLDTDFDIFNTHHIISTGFNGNWSEANQSSNSLNFASGSLSSPSCNFYQQSGCSYIYPSRSYSYGTGYVNGVTFQKNYMIGDEIKAFDDRLIILAGANYASTGSTSFNKNGTINGQSYDAAALTPTVGITYKILPWLSTYGLFQQSLTGGGFAPATYNGGVVTNANALIPPYFGTQWEGGLKATVGTNMLATVALYDIHKPAPFIQNNGDGTYTEVIGGSQHDQGIEFKLIGKLWDDLTLVGGASFMNPRLESVPSAPYQKGALVPEVSPVNGSLYAEYAIPFLEQAPWLHNLILTGGVRYQGPFKLTAPSSYSDVGGYDLTSVPGYAVADLGLRYQTQVEGHFVTFRFTVSNVTNYGYWVGAQGEGNPRTYAAMMDVKW
jgi:iron complex outermembrane receptor protein